MEISVLLLWAVRSRLFSCFLASCFKPALLMSKRPENLSSMSEFFLGSEGI